MRKLFLLGGGLLAAAPLLARPASTPTPTPQPRLTGGFGREAATPLASGHAGQSLADVVRAASEGHRKGTTTRPAVSITNQSLVTDPNRGKLTTSRATPRPAGRSAAAAPGPASRSNPAASPTPTPAGGESAAEEAKWRDIAHQARQRVASLKDRVASLEAEAKKLENDFYKWDDGQYRDNMIKPTWDKTREELATARGELEEAERDLADLPEKARKAGALPGWIRE